MGAIQVEPVYTNVLFFKESVLFILESTVGLRKKTQDFETELFAMGVDHSLMVKATPIVSDYGSEDCAFLPDPIADSRFKAGPTTVWNLSA